MSIKPIDSSSIHRITSGQVVIDLQTAVKELVENSLDAGATTIEVRFKEYGLKSIEIIDNGHGIPEANHASLALKHHTSKLSSYEDLSRVMTFGFRGEALSSLCALSSSIIVTTATDDQAPMGTVLEFDRSGKLKSCSGRAARQKGTTVLINELFRPLPVRRKEFQRNVKREFGKALSLLHAYALVPCTNENAGVRLTVSNQPEKGTRSVQLRTDGTSTLKSSVTNLWGPKAMDNLVPLDLQLEVETERMAILKKRGFQPNNKASVRVTGLVSKFALGCGRASTDRQFFYVNGRPCNPGKIQKTFNEVYKTFNVAQVPCVIADFRLPTDACDINVSPDKRTIFIHSENNLIQALKIALEEAYSGARSTFTVNNAIDVNSQQPIEVEKHSLAMTEGQYVQPDKVGEKNDTVAEGDTPLEVPKNGLPPSQRLLDKNSHVVDVDTPIITKETPSNVFANKPTPPHKVVSPHPSPSPPNKITSSYSSPSHSNHPESLGPVSSNESSDNESDAESRPRKRLRPDPPIVQSVKSRSVQLVLGTKEAAWNMRLQSQQGLQANKGTVKSTNRNARQNIRTSLTSFALPGSQVKSVTSQEEDELEEDTSEVQVMELEQDGEVEATRSPSLTEFEENERKDQKQVTLLPTKMTSNSTVVDLTGSDKEEIANTDDSTKEADSSRSEIVRTTYSAGALRLDMHRLSSVWSSKPSMSTLALASMSEVASATPTINVAANVSNAEDGKSATDELSRVIHKEDFESMQVLGQFNLGFIIVRRPPTSNSNIDDLFIVDQHAADEKYNFETLQQTTKIECQKLFRPRPLELTAAEELMAMENLDILRSNGFEVLVDEAASAGSGDRVKLVAQPVSKSTTFDVQDLSELLHLMKDRPMGQMVRCSKARAMFAMRACRKSVMVGMPLTKQQMTTVVHHMGTIEQPWNCPHGRPTMRHLVSLSAMGIPKWEARDIDWENFAK